MTDAGRALTPIPNLSSADEAALLTALAQNPPPRVLIASDLHLCSGRRDQTGVYDRRENFFADEAFGRWLAHYREPASSALLVLNGDILDFTRISARPRTLDDFQLWSRRLAHLEVSKDPQVLYQSIGHIERSYGLRTHDFKSVWKLHHVLDGHPGFVDALRGWLAAGHTILCVKGNHDLEVYWPLVRRALRDRVCAQLPDPETAARRIVFSQDGLTMANLVLEHGHNHEAMTAVPGEPQTGPDSGELRYPLGSFINRYLINPLERIDPFLDNIKPVQQALLAIARRHPITVVKLYLHGWKFALRAVRMRRALDGPAVVVLLGLLLPPLSAGLLALFLLRPSLWDKVAAALPMLNSTAAIGTGVLGVLSPVLMPYVVAAGLQVLRAMGLMRPRDELAEGARRLLARQFPAGSHWKRVYCLMGHTHQHDVQQFAATGREEFYLNSGTWIPLWSQDRPDLAGRVYYSFLLMARGDDGEYRHQSLVWDDQAGAPREPVLLKPRYGEVAHARA